jgi:hypothetical protein
VPSRKLVSPAWRLYVVVELINDCRECPVFSLAVTQCTGYKCVWQRDRWMESRSEKRGCIWLVRLLSPNTCTPSTQQPNRHPLSERFLAPNSAVQSSNQPVYFLSFLERSRSIMGNLLSGPDGEPELLWTNAFLCICLICLHSISSARAPIVLYQIWGSALARWSVLADLPEFP